MDVWHDAMTFAKRQFAGSSVRTSPARTSPVRTSPVPERGVGGGGADERAAAVHLKQVENRVCGPFRWLQGAWERAFRSAPLLLCAGVLFWGAGCSADEHAQRTAGSSRDGGADRAQPGPGPGGAFLLDSGAHTSEAAAIGVSTRGGTGGETFSSETDGRTQAGIETDTGETEPGTQAPPETSEETFAGDASDVGAPSRTGLDAGPRGADAMTDGGISAEDLVDAGALPPADSRDAQAPTSGEDCDGGSCAAACHPLLCSSEAHHRIAAGQYHSCVLLADGHVKCWGLNDFGQLGLGDTRERGRGTSGQPEMGAALAAVNLGARAVAIAAGADHTCALLEEGQVKCWGRNEWGQLGLGDAIHRGTGADDDPGMGGALPAVDLGTGVGAQAITAGVAHTCALLDNGAVKCWGGNPRGQLGQGDQLPRGDGSARDPGMGDALPPVELGEPAVRLSAGANHTCAVLQSGLVKCWGEGWFGQLGRGERVDVGTGDPDDPGMGLSLHHLSLGGSALAITAGYNHTCAVMGYGGVKCWGRNHFGQLGLGDRVDRDGGDPPLYVLEPLTFAQPARSVMASHGYHSCALLEDGSASCWGLNKYGQLGYGDTLERGTGEANDPWTSGATTVVQLGPQRIRGIATGLFHTCFLMDDYQVKCCGSNIVGQLGYEDPFDRCGGDPDFPMGEGLGAVPVD